MVINWDTVIRTALIEQKERFRRNEGAGAGNVGNGVSLSGISEVSLRHGKVRSNITIKFQL